MRDPQARGSIGPAFAAHGYGPLQCWEFWHVPGLLRGSASWKATAGGETFAEANSFDALLSHIAIVMNGEPFELRRADPAPGLIPTELLQLVE